MRESVRESCVNPFSHQLSRESVPAKPPAAAFRPRRRPDRSGRSDHRKPWMDRINQFVFFGFSALFGPLWLPFFRSFDVGQVHKPADSAPPPGPACPDPTPPAAPHRRYATGIARWNCAPSRIVLNSVFVSHVQRWSFSLSPFHVSPFTRVLPSPRAPSEIRAHSGLARPPTG